MKKLVSIVLLLAMALSFVACGTGSENPTGEQNKPNNNNPIVTAPVETVPPTTVPQKSDAVVAVEKLIEALGDITVDSKDMLDEVQSAVDALSTKEKAMVENMSKLEAAWASYNALVLEAAAAEIEEVIATMGDATYKNRNAVIAAMKLYNNASAEVQACVSNAEELKEAAKTVAKAMLDKMVVEEDFVRNLSFYYHSQWPRGKEYWYADERCFALPYLGKQGNDVWLRFVCNYTKKDWVFFKKITFACDDARFYKTFSYYDVVRDNSGGRVWEYIDMDVNATEIKILEAIASSEKTIIRFEGDNYYYDFTVTSKDKEAIRFTLDVYYLLGGK